jgi:hypothetical protein
VGDVELHLLQGLGENDVEPASTVDEDLVECDNPTRDNSVLSPKPLHLVIKR